MPWGSSDSSGSGSCLRNTKRLPQSSTFAGSPPCRQPRHRWGGSREVSYPAATPRLRGTPAAG